MRSLVLVLGLVACSGATEDPTDRDTDTDGDTGTTPEHTGTTDTDTTVFEKTAGLDGTVTGPGGGLADVDLRLCRGLACRNGTTDGGGAFSFVEIEVDWHSFEVVPPAGSGYATAFAPLLMASETTRTVEARMVAAETHALGAAGSAVEVAPGLTIEVGVGDLEAPTPFDDPPAEITGAAVAEADRLPLDQLTGTVLGVWYVGPFDTPASAAAGLPVSFENTFGLPDDAVARVWVGSYETSRWVDAGTVTASGGTLSGDARLPLLSTIVLIEE